METVQGDTRRWSTGSGCGGEGEGVAHWSCIKTSLKCNLSIRQENKQSIVEGFVSRQKHKLTYFNMCNNIIFVYFFALEGNRIKPFQIFVVKRIWGSTELKFDKDYQLKAFCFEQRQETSTILVRPLRIPSHRENGVR